MYLSGCSHFQSYFLFCFHLTMALLVMALILVLIPIVAPFPIWIVVVVFQLMTQLPQAQPLPFSHWLSVHSIVLSSFLFFLLLFLRTTLLYYVFFICFCFFFLLIEFPFDGKFPDFTSTEASSSTDLLFLSFADTQLGIFESGCDEATTIKAAITIKM